MPVDQAGLRVRLVEVHILGKALSDKLGSEVVSNIDEDVLGELFGLLDKAHNKVRREDSVLKRVGDTPFDQTTSTVGGAAEDILSSDIEVAVHASTAAATTSRQDTAGPNSLEVPVEKSTALHAVV